MERPQVIETWSLRWKRKVMPLYDGRKIVIELVGMARIELAPGGPKPSILPLYDTPTETVD